MSIKLTEGRTNEELKAQAELNLPIAFADQITFESLMWVHDNLNEKYCQINQAQPQPQTQMEAP